MAQLFKHFELSIDFSSRGWLIANHALFHRDVPIDPTRFDYQEERARLLRHIHNITSDALVVHSSFDKSSADKAVNLQSEITFAR